MLGLLDAGDPRSEVRTAWHMLLCQGSGLGGSVEGVGVGGCKVGVEMAEHFVGEPPLVVYTMVRSSTGNARNGVNWPRPFPRVDHRRRSAADPQITPGYTLRRTVPRLVV